MLITSLTKLGAKIDISLKSMILSPSFYQSSCLVQLTSHTSDPEDLLRLISQFNSFPSWVQLPDHHQLCQDHLVNSTNKIEFLLFAKKQLELEN